MLLRGHCLTSPSGTSRAARRFAYNRGLGLGRPAEHVSEGVMGVPTPTPITSREGRSLRRCTGVEERTVRAPARGERG